jgi:hypothetical protein
MTCRDVETRNLITITKMSSIRALLVLCIVAVAFGFAPVGRFAARSSMKMANIVETAVGAGK